MSDTGTRLKKLMADLFRCDVSQVTDEIGPGELPGWDSLGHVALMAEIQKQFGTHVPVEDAIAVESVTDLVAILDRLQSH
ncbi:MAG: acyl carrier protein [Planctomycetaceae bacterium]|jgi:acyl carrier protein